MAWVSGVIYLSRLHHANVWTFFKLAGAERLGNEGQILVHFGLLISKCTRRVKSKALYFLLVKSSQQIRDNVVKERIAISPEMD